MRNFEGSEKLRDRQIKLAVVVEAYYNFIEEVLVIEGEIYFFGWLIVIYGRCMIPSCTMNRDTKTKK